MKYYCIGIKGAGMSSLASSLKDLGHDVCGYDDHKEYKFTEEGLNKRDIKIYYEPTQLSKDTIVTYSKAFSLEHPELKRVKKLGLKIVDYNQVVGEITKNFETIAVNGTHGKTTISALSKEVLKSLDVNYYVGDGSGEFNKKGKFLIIEADEFNKHFLAYYPKISITSNIELDHVECYPNGLKEIIKTFEIFNNKAEVSIINIDDKNVKKMKLKNKVITYGLDCYANCYPLNISYTQDGISFDAVYNLQIIGRFELPFYGKHMLYNSLATIALACYLGLDYEEINKRICKFEGAKRRFKLSRHKSNIIVDDYAHHPSEIKTTLSAIKQKYPEKDIIAIFMPNTYSRTLALKNDFIKCFSLAKHVYITPINCDRENPKDYDNITSDVLVSKIKNAEILELKDIKKLEQYENSVIAFLSCADISKYIELYKKEV